MPSEVLLARVCKGLKRAASAFLPRELTPRSLTLTVVCTVTQAHLEVQTWVISSPGSETGFDC